MQGQPKDGWRKTWGWMRHAVLIAAGCAVGAIAYPLYLVPNGIAPGGLTGIATVLHYAFGVPVGISSLVMNVPLFIMGYRSMGRMFALRTLIATVLFSLLIDIFRFEPLTSDPLLASAFGGLLLGLGLGLILRGGATTGGTDLLARLVHRRFSSLSMGVFLLAFDSAVILLAGFTMSASHAMYSMISVFIITKVLDTVLVGLGTDKACYIITTKSEPIVKRLLQEVDRGVTKLKGTGAYSNNQVDLLLCVVGRMELMRVKELVSHEDPQAFVFITDTHETLGEGFGNLAGNDEL